MRVAVARPWPGLARDTLVSLLAIAVVGGSTAAYNLAVGRRLGETVLGHAGLSLAVGIGLAQLVASGIGPATTRFTAAHLAVASTAGAGAALRRGVGSALLLGLLAAAAAWATADRWSAWIGIAPALVAQTVTLVALQTAYLGLKAGLYGFGFVPRYAVIELAAGCAFAVTLAGLLVGAPVHLVAPFLVANVVFIAGAAWTLGPALRERPATEALLPAPPRAPMARYALVATIGSAAALARLHLAPLVTGAAWPAREVGLLQAALSFLLLVMLVPRALELALFPALSGAFSRRDRAAFERDAGDALAASAFVLALVAGGLLVAGPELLELLFGRSFAEAAPALVGVLIAGWALGLAVPAVAALSGADAVAVPNTAAVIGLGASLAYWLWRVPSDGAEGAAMGLAVGSVVNAVLPLGIAHARYGLPLRPALVTTLRAIGFVIVAIGISRLTAVPAAPAAAAYCFALIIVERDAVRRLKRHRRGAAPR